MRAICHFCNSHRSFWLWRCKNFVYSIHSLDLLFCWVTFHFEYNMSISDFSTKKLDAPPKHIFVLLLTRLKTLKLNLRNYYKCWPRLWIHPFILLIWWMNFSLSLCFFSTHSKNSIYRQSPIVVIRMWNVDFQLDWCWYGKFCCQRYGYCWTYH